MSTPSTPSGNIDSLALSRTIVPALIIGTLALLAQLAFAFIDPLHATRGYLIGWYFCTGAALGAMGMVMMHHLTAGDWGWPVRRLGEAAGMTLPLLAIAYIPIAVGIKQVYPWASAATTAAEPLLRHRHFFFNTPFVVGRTAIYFAIWITLAFLLRRWSLRQDSVGGEALLVRMRRLSALGIVIYFLTMSLASMDWIASREVDWYTSTFGFVTITGQAVTGLCVLIITLAIIRHVPALRGLIFDKATHDLGNLLMVCVVLWAYVSFFQFLVIYTGNTQEDLIWFHHRESAGWQWVGRGLIFLHFSIPFVLLLFQNAKRDLRILAAIAAWVLIMRMMDAIWSFVPSNLEQSPRGVHWLDFTGLIGVCGVWWSYFAWQAGRWPLAARARASVVPQPLEEEGHEPAIATT